MDIIVKIYENYWSNFEKFNFFTKEQISIEQNLESFDIATLNVTWYDIQEYNKIEIYEAGSPDVLTFRGVVHEPNKTISTLTNSTSITCRSERAIMKQRKALVDRTKNDTVENIINELLADYTLDSWATNIGCDRTINLSYKMWADYESILDEIALQCGGYWDIQNWVLIMDSLLGLDKTSWSGQVNVLFTGNEWDNIKNVNIVWQSTRANVIIWEDGVTTHISKDETDWIVYWVQKYRINWWDLVEKTNQMLKKMNIRQRILNVELDPNENINANIGDKLNLEISNVTWLEDIISEVLVTEKLITYNYTEKQIVIKVWTNVIQEDTLGNIIVWIKKELDLIS